MVVTQEDLVGEDRRQSGCSRNMARQYFVTLDDTEKVINACPDAEWRAIVALARFGGLRVPSELLALEWTHIDWDAGKVTVTSPKTERAGKPYRIIPLFPELRPYLEELFELAEPGQRHVITRYRSDEQNLRTTFLAILRRAGVNPWPKLFQNCRSTRETELARKFPIAAVVAWMGNTQAVALDHYLQVTDEDFTEALESDAGDSEIDPHFRVGQVVPGSATRCKVGAESGALSGHKEGRSGHSGGTGRARKPKKTPVLQGFAGVAKHAQQDSNLRPAD